MAHTVRNKLRGLAAALVAVFAALALVPGTAMAAQIGNWTDEDNQQVTVTVNNLDENTEVTVYKVADTALDTTHNTTSTNPVGTVSADAVAGYTDGTVSDDDVNTLYAQAQNGTSVSFNWDTNHHTITFQADPGLYVVVANSTDSNTEYQHTIVAVNPVGHQGENGDPSYWTVDDVTINMKKTNTTLDKTYEYTGQHADNQYVQVGDTLHFTVTFTLGADEQDFVLYDHMSNGLQYTANSIVMKNIAGTLVVSGDNNDAFELVNLNDGGNGFQLNFKNDWTTAKDAATQTSLHAGTYTLEYDATVTDAIKNSMSNMVSSSDNSTGKTVTENYGWVKVKKVVEGTDEVLSDAEFGLYLDEQGTQPVLDKNGQPVTFSTNAQGIDEETAVLLKQGTYYVKETKAPAGYQLNPDAFEVVVTDAGGCIEVVVPDTPAGPGQGVNLPTTGGAGTVALTAAGVVLVAGAAAFIVRSRKQN